jgi:hypothetical protein
MTGMSVMANGPEGAGWRRYASIQVIAAILAGIVVVVYVVFLLLSNYRSERNLQRNLLAQFEQETKIRAQALEYFLSTATENINNLATSRELFTFFENRDLGMSMEYGLKLSLFPIRERFLGLIRRTRIGGVPLYSRIVLVDRYGRLVVDTEDATSRSESGWKAFVAPRHREKPVIELPDGNRIVVSYPYTFKDRYEGQIVAWIPLEVPYATLLREEQGSNHLLYIGVPGTGRIHFPNSAVTEAAPSEVYRKDAPGNDAGDARLPSAGRRHPDLGDPGHQRRRDPEPRDPHGTGRTDGAGRPRHPPRYPLHAHPRDAVARAQARPRGIPPP